MGFFSDLFSTKNTLPNVDKEKLSRIALEAARSTLRDYREESTKRHLEECILSPSNKEIRQKLRDNRRKGDRRKDTPEPSY